MDKDRSDNALEILSKNDEKTNWVKPIPTIVR